MIENRDRSYSKEHLFRLPTDLRWSGRVHEAVLGYAQTNGDRRVTPGVFFWEGTKTPEKMSAKLERNLTILLEECAASPKNARNWYYLSQTFQNRGEDSLAIDAFVKCADLGGWPPESASARFRAGLCLKRLGELRKGEELAAKGLTRLASSPELLSLAAICAFDQGEFDRSVEWAERCVENGEFQPRRHTKKQREAIVFRCPEPHFEAPFDILRFAFFKLGDEAASRKANRLYFLSKEIREASFSYPASLSPN